MIDIIMLSHYRTERAQTEADIHQALDGVANANLVAVPGANGVGKSRYQAWAKCKSEYISFVDNDDRLPNPEVLKDIEEFMDANPHVGVVSTYQQLESYSGTVGGPVGLDGRFRRMPFGAAQRVTPLVVMRRSAVVKHLPVLIRYKQLPELCLYMTLEMAGVSFYRYNVVGYTKVQHRGPRASEPLTERGTKALINQYSKWVRSNDPFQR